MTPKQVVQWLIVAVIMTMIAWSVVNVSHYARIYHDSAIVWTLGASVGVANAVSVYCFVIAKTRQQTSASVSGILLFGGASGFIQMFLYQHDNAPLMTAVIFGWFGPVAEGVLSWLHASLSVEDDSVVTVTNGSMATENVKPVAPVLMVADIPTVIDNDNKVTEDDKTPIKPTTTERRNILKKRVKKGQPTGDDIGSWSREFAVSARTIFRDIEALTVTANGNGVHA